MGGHALKLESNRLDSQWNPVLVDRKIPAAGYIQGRAVLEKPRESAKIQFQKIFIATNQEAPKDIRGAVALTQDDLHQGWLHILIFLAQLFNALFTGQKRDNINLCHGEIILGVNEKGEKKGQLILAHSIFSGIKTTSEDHKKDEVITGIVAYLPVDERIRALMAKYAEQTAVNFREANLDPKAKEFKERFKKEVGQFSIRDGIATLFHRQVLKPYEAMQKQVVYAAADLLKGDKFRDANGELASYFCTGYMLTVMQGTALISALQEWEKDLLSNWSRDDIAQYLLKRIQDHRTGDRIAETYWNNEFMQIDAHHAMSYFLGDVLDKTSSMQEKG